MMAHANNIFPPPNQGIPAHIPNAPALAQYPNQQQGNGFGTPFKNITDYLPHRLNLSIHPADGGYVICAEGWNNNGTSMVPQMRICGQNQKLIDVIASVLVDWKLGDQ
jgi:hypothetical protein